jgi:hypothetical protein
MGWVVLVFSFGCVSEETQSLTTCRLDAARTLPTETPAGRPQQIMLDSLGRVIVAGDKRIGELTPDGTALSWSASVDNARGIFLEPTGDTLLLAGSTGVNDVFAMLLRDHGAAQTIAHTGLWDAVRIFDGDPPYVVFDGLYENPRYRDFVVRSEGEGTLRDALLHVTGLVMGRVGVDLITHDSDAGLIRRVKTDGSEVWATSYDAGGHCPLVAGAPTFWTTDEGHGRWLRCDHLLSVSPDGDLEMLGLPADWADAVFLVLIDGEPLLAMADHQIARLDSDGGVVWSTAIPDEIWDDPRSAGFERAPGAPSLAAFFVGGQNMLPQTRWIDTETGELCDTQRL